MTIWALNANKDKIADLIVNLKGHTIVSDKIEVITWNPGETREGKVSLINLSNTKQFKAKVHPDSLSCFTLKVK